MQLVPLTTKSPVTGATRIITSDLLNETYLTPRSDCFDPGKHIDDAVFPWAQSYLQDPEGVEVAVKAALIDLMHATPGLNPENIDLQNLPDGRAKTHLMALKTLWIKVGILPEDLAAIHHVLSCEKTDALEALPLTTATPCPFATRAQESLHAALMSHHGNLLGDETKATANGTLKHIQENLVSAALSGSVPQDKDESVAIFGLRDPIEEASFVAAHIQKLCDEGMHWEDFGVLAPDDPIYHSALQTAFERVGIVLSGAEGAIKRDHKGELLTLALTCLKSHNSNMARASLCLSPLMPWNAEEGCRLADAIMFGGLKNALNEIEDAKSVLDLLKPINSSKALFTRLNMLANLTNKAPELELRIGALRVSQKSTDLDWHSLEKAAAPRFTTGDNPAKSAQGVGVFSEHALPWRPVKVLIVLGMTGPNWPRPARSNPFFTEGEFDLIEQKTGLALTSRKRDLSRGLELFRQQLAAAQERLTLCAPARDLMGKKLPASVALTLIAKAMGELKDPLSLITPPSNVDAYIRKVPVDAGLSTPNVPANGLLNLGGNLLTLRHEEGSNVMKPQSVSRLETMLVSPLAWTLGEIGAEEKLWAPQDLDVMLRGTIVHDVLEHCFPPDCELPDDAEILTAIPSYISDALERCAPWLLDDEWALEHKNLMVEVEKSTLAWAQFLRSTGAKVIGTEKHLQGTSPSLNIRIHGYADCILEMPDKRILIVDHKRSKSENRIKRLEAQSDLQVTLYKEMLLNPQGDDALDLRATGAGNIVAAYHTTMDHSVIVSHETKPITGTQAVNGDISSTATNLLSERVKDLTVGNVPLNSISDTHIFEKAFCITPYALDSNRLVQAFMVDDQEAGK